MTLVNTTTMWHPITSTATPSFPAGLGVRHAYLFPFSDQVLHPRTTGATTVPTRLAIDPPRMGRLLASLVATRTTHLTTLPRVRTTLGRLRRGRTGNPQAPYALRVDVTHHGHTATATLTGDILEIGAGADLGTNLRHYTAAHRVVATKIDQTHVPVEIIDGHDPHSPVATGLSALVGWVRRRCPGGFRWIRLGGGA